MTNINRHKATKIGLTFIIFFSFCLMFYPFFTAILLAGLFGFALEPLIKRYSPKKKRRKLSTALILFFMFLAISGPLTLVVYRLIVKAQEISKVGIQNTPLFASLNKAFILIFENGLSLVQAVGIDPDIVPDISGLLQQAGSWVIAGTTAFVAYLPIFVLGLFVFTCALYLFITESKVIKTGIKNLDLLAPHELDKIIRVIQRSSFVSLVSTLAIAGIQAVVVASAAFICGYKEFFVVFVVTFIFSMIPVIGAAPVAIVLCFLSFIQGEIGAGIGLAVAAIVAGTVDNVVKPLIVNSADEELHPVVSLIALIGGIIVYGIPGLLLGPVLTQLAFRITPILFTNEGKVAEDITEQT